MGSGGYVPMPYTYHLSKAPATPLSGGSIKIFDPSVFEVATTIVGAIVTVEPGAMRELHVRGAIHTYVDKLHLLIIFINSGTLQNPNGTISCKRTL